MLSGLRLSAALVFIGLTAAAIITFFVISFTGITYDAHFLLRMVLIGIIIAGGLSTLSYSMFSKDIKSLARLEKTAQDIVAGNIFINHTARENSKNNEIGRIAGSLQDISKILQILHTDFLTAKNNIQGGNPRFQIEDLRLQGAYADMVDAINSVANDYAFSCDLISEPLLFIDDKMRVNFANKAIARLTGTDAANVVGMHVNDFLHADIAGHPATIKAFKEKTPQLEIDIQLELSPGQLTDFEYNCKPYVLNNGKTGALILMTNLTHIRELQRLEQKLNDYRHERAEVFTDVVLSSLEKGRLTLDFPHVAHDDDTKEIAQDQEALEGALKKSIDTIKGYVDEITDILKEIADNNFDVSIERDFVGDFGSIKDSVGLITEHVSSAMHEIQTTSAGTDAAAMQLSMSVQDLMTSFQEQSVAISDARDMIDTLTQKTRKNADDAQSASNLSDKVSEAAASGTQHMSDMSAAMEEIKQSSEEIAKVVSIIESIAFQTNLLALNASVEAARAGEHGKGFAVVAEEVRNLAGRSATAAKDTSEMLAKSLGRVNLGVEKTEETATALRNIAEMTASVTDVVANIADVSKEQNEEINRIQKIMEDIYRGTNDNSNVVQNNVAVSEELSSQASMVNALVEQFKIRQV